MIHAKKIETHFFSAKFYLTHIFFGQKNFDPKKCWPKIFFIQNFVSAKKDPIPQIFLTKRKFRPKIFLTKIFSGQMSTKFFMILDFGIWDLGFSIWGSGSVTWNSGFGIQDLGLRIWDLDSSWPTDPFDQLDVAQLSKIFTMICCFTVNYNEIE